MEDADNRSSLISLLCKGENKMTDQVENQAAETVQLSLQDIATMVQIIDVCSKRGGLKVLKWKQLVV